MVRSLGALAVTANSRTAPGRHTESLLDVPSSSHGGGERQALGTMPRRALRIVAAAGEERRRVVRDLPDGAQQPSSSRYILKLVSRRGANEQRARSLSARALEHADARTSSCASSRRDPPAVLTHSGLRSLSSARVPRLSRRAQRRRETIPPPRSEATAYFRHRRVLPFASMLMQRAPQCGPVSMTASVSSMCATMASAARRRRDRPCRAGRTRLAALGGEFRVGSPAGRRNDVAAAIPSRDSAKPLTSIVRVSGGAGRGGSIRYTLILTLTTRRGIRSRWLHSPASGGPR